MDSLMPSKYLITVFFNDTCRLVLEALVEQATGITDKNRLSIFQRNLSI
jgi:hypothetical protein